MTEATEAHVVEEKEVKWCPLAGRDDNARPCIEKQCAWWIIHPFTGGDCAVAVIADGISPIKSYLYMK